MPGQPAQIRRLGWGPPTKFAEEVCHCLQLVRSFRIAEVFQMALSITHRTPTSVSRHDTIFHMGIYIIYTSLKRIPSLLPELALPSEGWAGPRNRTRVRSRLGKVSRTGDHSYSAFEMGVESVPVDQKKDCVTKVCLDFGFCHADHSHQKSLYLRRDGFSHWKL